MNAQVFKKLIKEAVREAVREELKQVLAEHAASQLVGGTRLNENFNFDSSHVGANQFPKTPQQVMQERQSMAQKFGMPKPEQQIMNDWGFGAAEVEPKAALKGGGDFSAFLQDTAQNLNPNEVAQMRMGGGD